ncbi:MAG: glycosyltransferase [Nostoc sp. CreGUA01]|nr:glycosyltransferase [Nostoc sp. CreGUA01]
MPKQQHFIKTPEVCHVVASVNEYVGGVGCTVISLAEILFAQGIPSHIFTLDDQYLGKQKIPTSVQFHSYPAHFLARKVRGFHPQASQALLELASKEVNLIHNHGLWMFPNLYARQAALKNHLPLVISPHGMLESWSLKRSVFKKQLAWLLYEQKNLKSATVFHATSAQEASSIRSLGFKQPIALIPIGIDINEFNEKAEKELLTKLFPELGDKKWLLFLSRLHPKKGIDNLLYVWQKIQAKFPDWHLIIAGPDLIGYQANLEQLVEQLNLGQRVTFTGMLSGQYKASAFSNADLFVLPTHSENFGIAIAESLAYSLPAITTKSTPWQDLETYSCGWWIEDNQQALMDILLDAMQLPESKRREMGLKGRNLIESKYSWNAIATDMASVYHWILGGGEVPDCVQLYDS